MKDVLGNHLKDRLFHLVHWLSITHVCERRVKTPSIWKESLMWIVPRIRIARGGGIWKGDVLVADLEELENTLMYPELLVRIWTLCKKAASIIIGISTDQEICLVLEQVSLSLLFKVRNLQKDLHGPGGD